MLCSATTSVNGNEQATGHVWSDANKACECDGDSSYYADPDNTGSDLVCLLCNSAENRVLSGANND